MPSVMQAAAAAMLFWELYHGALPAARLALTLHNMDSQGECSQEEFGFTGAAPQIPTLPECSKLVQEGQCRRSPGAWW